MIMIKSLTAQSLSLSPHISSGNNNNKSTKKKTSGQHHSSSSMNKNFLKLKNGFELDVLWLTPFVRDFKSRFLSLLGGPFRAMSLGSSHSSSTNIISICITIIITITSACVCV